MSTPESIIYVCSGVRLNSRYEHSIYFASKAAQESYFAGKVVKTFPAYSYLRKSWSLQVAATMEQARTWSYLFFRNGSGKTYYYFIKNIEYKNDNAVELTLELDVIQTYMFDYTMLDCFVERQHTTTDELGEHTVDEGLEVGELYDNSVDDWEDLNDLCILILSTVNPNFDPEEMEKPAEALAYSYNGVFSGLHVWAVAGDKWQQWAGQLDALGGFEDSIVAMWMYPKALVQLGGEENWVNANVCHTVEAAKYQGTIYHYGEKPTSVAGYTPKNKKVLCYPYSFLYATNNAGSSAVYRWERFMRDNITFDVAGTLSPEAAVKMYPNAYNGLEYSVAGSDIPAYHANYEDGLSLGNFPTCAWDADVYKLWLAQNQNQLHAAGNAAVNQIIGGAVAAGVGLAMGNVMAVAGGAGMAYNGYQQIQNILAQKADMEIQPPQARGSLSTSVNVSANKQTFSFYHKSVTKERAKIIDDYFTMYGYKLGRVQAPNIAARPAFTYVKTIGCHVVGNLCDEDLTAIERVFDNGITFWKNGDKIADYTQDNRV